MCDLLLIWWYWYKRRCCRPCPISDKDRVPKKMFHGYCPDQSSLLSRELDMSKQILTQFLSFHLKDNKMTEPELSKIYRLYKKKPEIRQTIIEIMEKELLSGIYDCEIEQKCVSPEFVAKFVKHILEAARNNPRSILSHSLDIKFAALDNAEIQKLRELFDLSLDTPIASFACLIPSEKNISDLESKVTEVSQCVAPLDADPKLLQSAFEGFCKKYPKTMEDPAEAAIALNKILTTNRTKTKERFDRTRLDALQLQKTLEYNKKLRGLWEKSGGDDLWKQWTDFDKTVGYNRCKRGSYFEVRYGLLSAAMVLLDLRHRFSYAGGVSWKFIPNCLWLDRDTEKICGEIDGVLISKDETSGQERLEALIEMKTTIYAVSSGSWQQCNKRDSSQKFVIAESIESDASRYSVPTEGKVPVYVVTCIPDHDDTYGVDQDIARLVLEKIEGKPCTRQGATIVTKPEALTVEKCLDIMASVRSRIDKGKLKYSPLQYLREFPDYVFIMP